MACTHNTHAGVFRVAQAVNSTVVPRLLAQVRISLEASTLTPAALATALAGVGLALHATRVAPYHPIQRTRRVDVPPWWPALDILHLSDVHLRRSDPRLFAAQRRALSRLDREADLVCVTGDVCERAADVPLVVQLLSALKPRLGTYVILGNHEYGAGSPQPRDTVERAGGLLNLLLNRLYRADVSSGPLEGEAIVAALRGAGIRVLRNQGVRIWVDGRSVWLAGVDGGWAGRADVRAAMSGRRADEAGLVLIHEPELAFAAVENGAELVLAGHTHGGQVVLPWIGPPYWHRLDSRLRQAAGVQTIGSAQLHTSAGLGQLVPLRFGCPPELVWLHCVPQGTESPSVSLRGGLRGARRAQWLPPLHPSSTATR